MGRLLTLAETRERARIHELKSDLSILCYDWQHSLDTVRARERRMERHYPVHGILRRTAVSHFLQAGLDVYPNGITVDGAGTCLDLCVLDEQGITFVECLTAFWVHEATLKRKRGIEKFGRLLFVMEDRPKDDFDGSRDWFAYVNRVRRVARRNTVYWCDCSKMKMRRCRSKTS